MCCFPYLRASHRRFCLPSSIFQSSSLLGLANLPRPHSPFPFFSVRKLAIVSINFANPDFTPLWRPSRGNRVVESHRTLGAYHVSYIRKNNGTSFQSVVKARRDKSWGPCLYQSGILGHKWRKWSCDFYIDYILTSNSQTLIIFSRSHMNWTKSGLSFYRGRKNAFFQCKTE